MPVDHGSRDSVSFFDFSLQWIAFPCVGPWTTTQGSDGMTDVLFAVAGFL
jgi:hypothetical protein